MGVGGIIVISLICILGVAMVFLLSLGNPFSKKYEEVGRLSSMMQSQRAAASAVVTEEKKNIIVQKEDATELTKLTLQKRLKYAQWTRFPTSMFYLLQVIISLVVGSLLATFCDWWFVVFSLISGPIWMNKFLNRAMNKRFERFDEDYASFLLSLVGMLKTGMNTMSAVDAAAKSLEPDSLVREESELMVERLRYGVTEDQSIGSFGETINHPEIELFVQALLLSRSVGGKLSDTLERLSHQVRKRQFFRKSAQAAVSMQRGSIWIIIAIIVGIEGYMYYMDPDIIKDAVKSDIGWSIYQGAMAMIIVACLLMTKITKIRI